MAAEWYYAKGDKKHGPVTEERLRELAEAGELSPADLVWKQGMPGWAAASKNSNLFPKSVSMPPPLPSKAGSFPPPLPIPSPKSANDEHEAGVAIIELLKKGRQKIARGDYALAIETFSEAICLDPTNADAYFGRGSAYFAKGYLKKDYANAIPDLTKALRLNPAHKEAQEHLAEAKIYLADASEESSVKNEMPNWDGCGPCSRCRTVINMKFDAAICPIFANRIEWQEAFQICSSYAGSLPPEVYFYCIRWRANSIVTH